MKKILVALCLFAFIQTIQAQTKEETENWLKEKFEKQNKLGGVRVSPMDLKASDGKYYDGFVKNIKMDVKNGVISLYYEEWWNERGNIGYMKYRTRIENIVVFAIDSIYEDPMQGYDSKYQPPNVITLKLNKWLAEEYQIKRTDIHEDKSYSTIEYTVHLPLYSDLEENFLERFKKAIVHYKTFFPKPKKKETF